MLLVGEIAAIIEADIVGVSFEVTSVLVVKLVVVIAENMVLLREVEVLLPVSLVVLVRVDMVLTGENVIADGEVKVVI